MFGIRVGIFHRWATSALRTHTFPLAALTSLACSVAPPETESRVVHARFDPNAGVIPTPTDVLRDREAGHLAIPDAPEDLAEKSLAEVAVIRALNKRDGWPSRTQAELSFSDPIDPASISPKSVRVFEVGASDTRALDLVPRGDSAASPERVLIDPPAGGWKRGGRYFIAALGGPDGLTGRDGEPVVADATFWFLRVRGSLLEHASAIPGATAEERQESAEKLEDIRADLAPYFEHLESVGIPRRDVVALWSFTISEAPEVLMDKDAGQMPLPCDFLRDPVSGFVDIPVRDEDTDLEREMKHELRSVDGFALSADLTFEVSAAIDPATLTTSSVRVYAVSPGSAKLVPVPVTLAAERGSTGIAITLAGAPLEPATDHVVMVTDELKDARGRAVAAMMPGVLSMIDQPVFEGGASTIDSLDSETAAKVEPVRKSVARALELARSDRTIPVDHLAAIWPFKTMSIVDQMKKARDAAELLDIPPDPMDIEEKGVIAAALEFPLASLTMLRVGKVFDGTIIIPDFLDPITRKNKDDGGYEPRKVGFTMTIPRSAREDRPLRIAIFGHGLMTERRFVLALGDALAAEGIAVISIDFPYHGDRTHCFWSGPQCIVNPVGQNGELICPDPCESGSTCAPDGQCVDNGGHGNHLSEWPVVKYPQASGGAFLEVENLAGTRDHFYQSASDLSTLYRSLREGDWKSAIGYELDPDIGYVGQSLGGITGALFAAMHPEVHRVMLNVPGADLVELFRESKLFSPHMDAFLNREDIPPGTAKHEQLLNVARWIMDAVDPQSFARYLTERPIDAATPFAERKVFIQMATFDLVIGNEQTKVLERLSGVPWKDYIAEHAFLVVPIEPAYLFGVRDVARFLATGETP